MAAKKTELKYTVEKEIATISEVGTAKKKLTLTAWGDNPAKYDIRTWVTRPDGGETPKKGITFSGDELTELKKILADFTPEQTKTAPKTEKAPAKATKKTADTVKSARPVKARAKSKATLEKNLVKALDEYVNR